MNILHKIISSSLSPNTQTDDVINALGVLFRPWVWMRGGAVTRVTTWFEHTYTGYTAFAFNAGRSALYTILLSFGIRPGDEVMVQAFTCVAVPNSVLWTGAKPIYVDIDDSLNFDVRDAEKKITDKVKAIIVQHTFGVPANMRDVMQFVKKHKLILIEDCAHSLGATYNGKNIGSFGDAAIFSFGRDKVLSSVFGGIASIRNVQKRAIHAMRDISRKTKQPTMFWVMQQLLHPVVFSVILPLYRLHVGKMILVVFQKIRLLSKPVYDSEKLGQRPDDFPARYPNGLAILLLAQLKKLNIYNSHRISNAAIYRKYISEKNMSRNIHFQNGSIFLRYPMIISDPNIARLKAKKRGVLLGNWYHNIIDPSGVDFSKIFYIKGSCPHAEYISKSILNLPTMVTNQEAMYITSIFT